MRPKEPIQHISGFICFAKAKGCTATNTVGLEKVGPKGNDIRDYFNMHVQGLDVEHNQVSNLEFHFLVLQGT